ncbi:hypothetical protein HY992_02490 [Candidatus Micrarchaeota archaeon]|nr:hypothetical protein [Candidatus Micrarchaeota archaeon]
MAVVFFEGGNETVVSVFLLRLREGFNCLFVARKSFFNICWSNVQQVVSNGSES